MTKTLRIATRQSPLALQQAYAVRDALLQHHPDLTISFLYLTTAGDRFLEASLLKVGGKSLFVKELENALLAGEADIAVHSMKDVPTQLPKGLEIAVICERASPFDVLVSPHYPNLDALPLHARVGTSSLRRQAQLLAYRSDLHIIPLRGNVNTRIVKLDNGEFDAIVLAEAGLVRLNWEERISAILPTDISLPAVGQGALGIECRQNDTTTYNLIALLHHLPTAYCVQAERTMNDTLGGGCHIPISGYAMLKRNSLELQGRVMDPTGKQMIAAIAAGPATSYSALGNEVAAALIAQGADKILKNL